MSYPIYLSAIRGKVAEAINEELFKAERAFGGFASAHEGVAVIREEYLELEAECFKKQSAPGRNEAMRKEAIQLAAMAIRFIQDLKLAEEQTNA